MTGRLGHSDSCLANTFGSNSCEQWEHGFLECSLAQMMETLRCARRYPSCRPCLSNGCICGYCDSSKPHAGRSCQWERASCSWCTPVVHFLLLLAFSIITLKYQNQLGFVGVQIQGNYQQKRVENKQEMNVKQPPKFLSGDKELYDKYTIRRDRVVGRGISYVYEAHDEEGTVECVKEVRLEDKMNEFIFYKEVELLNKLKANPHPNIVEFRGSYCLQERNHFRHRKGYIQMEKGITSLKEFLEHRKQTQAYFSEDDVLSFITSLLDAFVHLQKVELAHRDVKPSNIIIFSEDPLYFKVCDVGAGTAVGICDMTQNRTVIGTPFYLSPELYTAYRQKHHLTNYKVFKSDCYSLGLVFLEFCTLRRHQDRLNSEKESIETAIGDIKKRYPNIVGIGKVLRRMLDENVKTRADFLQIQSYVQENDLLRNKIDSLIKLDPELISKLTKFEELIIDKFQDLSILSKIASSGNSAPLLKIHLTTATGVMKPNERDMLEQLRNIRHVAIADLQLNFQMCGLTEKEAQIVAYALTKNFTLKTLKLHFWNNSIKSEGLVSIMQAIQTIIGNIEELYISVPNNSIKLGVQFEELFNLSSAVNLRVFSMNMSFNQIHSEYFPKWVKDISQATEVIRLQLFIQKIRINQISFSKGIRELQKLKNLETLIFKASDNSIRDEGIFGLSDLFAYLPQLTNFTILVRNSEISDKGLSEFLKSLSDSTNLQTLKINLIGNLLTENSIKLAPNALQKLKKVREIDFNISNNKIGDLGIKSLMTAFISLTSVTKLRLVFDGCQISEKGCLYIGRLISQLASLTDFQLSLRYNQIKIKGVQCICTGLLTTKKVKRLKLVLQATKIGDYSANYLASCLLKIRGLSFVDLNMENCELGENTMENITKLVKECSKRAQEITVSMRKNRQIRLQLYEQIKKELNSSRIAIRVDDPSNRQETLDYSRTSI